MSLLSFDAEKLQTQYHHPEFAMAYGSGVFAQEGYQESDRPMVDLIFGVEHSEDWHRTNLQENKGDYSMMARFLGPKAVNYMQRTGANIYYNPFVLFEDDQGKREIKYGVISIADLIEDLKNWKSLYTAGRLQKPVKILNAQADVLAAMEQNQRQALEVAFLLLPENFTEKELYEAIAGISYMGDTRMKLAENPDKVRNIVKKNMEGFSTLYRRFVEEHLRADWLESGHIQQDRSPQTIVERVQALPQEIQIRLPQVDQISDLEFLRKSVEGAVTQIVHDSSFSQTLKGFFSAGFRKSAAYSGAKVKKRLKS